MKERPIIFSAPMVRALLDGTKTQTRRVAPIRELKILQHPGDMLTWSVSFLKPVKGVLSSHSGGKLSDLQARSIIASRFNPYGQPGDRLWVRESFTDEAGGTRPYPGDHIYYKADTHQPLCERWSPSIHMPRWASRITLEITGVRVERLKDISEADAIAEGVELGGPIGHLPTYLAAPYAYQYAQLWESINGPGSWDENPWVWVLEFNRIER